MHILRLPTELLLMIAGFLNRPYFSRLSRSCQYLYSLLTPILNAEISRESNDILLWAARTNRASAVHVALSHGAQINATDCRFRGPLNITARYNNLQAAQALISHAANQPDQGDRSSLDLLTSQIGKLGWTPLHVAADGNSTAVARLLVEKGSDLEAVSDNGSTPLHLAARRNSTAVACLLLENGSDTEAVDHNRYTALHHAALRKSLDVARVLIQHHADINSAVANLSTPLHFAVSTGNEDAVRLLLDAGADPNLYCFNRQYRAWLEPGGMWRGLLRTPLHIAVEEGYTGVINMLIAYGAHVGVVDEYGETALHIAENRGELDHIRILEEAGAPPDVVDKDGKRLIDLNNLLE